jgi:hypothetical protein
MIPSETPQIQPSLATKPADSVLVQRVISREEDKHLYIILMSRDCHLHNEMALGLYFYVFCISNVLNTCYLKEPPLVPHIVCHQYAPLMMLCVALDSSDVAHAAKHVHLEKAIKKSKD